jgi:hypothetical protein
MSSMDDDSTSVVRGCLVALAFDACLLVAGWLAWRLLRAAIGTS